MPKTPNKVKFGIKNAHYAVMTTGEDGSVTFGTPVAIPGSVNFTMDAQGETSTFYADDMAYYVTATNAGYSGTFEVALVPDSFRVDVLKETLDPSAQVLVEHVDSQPATFALLFEFNGDQHATRHILYNCTATRASVSGSTTTKTTDPTTETLNLTVSPLPSGVVRAKTTAKTPDAVYAAWYDAVWQPLSVLTVTSEAGSSSGKTAVTVAPAKASGNAYKYSTGASVTLPAYGAEPGAGYQDWDGSEEITATTGNQLAIVEVDSGGKAVAGGIATVTANGG